MSCFSLKRLGCLALGICFLVWPAHAQDGGASAPLPPIDVMPAEMAFKKGLMIDTDAITHPPLKMTPDKSEMIRLDAPAHSVIVGNPNHLSVIADSSLTLVLVPRAPGATYLTVLGQAGRVLMQRHVLVASPQEKYMRVRRSCASGKSADCQETSVFYCPDMCHKIIVSDGDSASASSGQASAASAAGTAGSMAQGTTADPAGADSGETGDEEGE